ncbi:MAG: long-chain fatty acid--CoA ligase [Gemmatimonadales bacterium]
MPSLSMDLPLTIPAILRRLRTHFGDKTVVSRRGEGALHQTTYRQMLERSAKLAGALRQLGIDAGDRVATLCWNHDRHLEAYYAVPAMGAVLHTLNLRLHADELAFIASDAGDRILIVDDDLLPLAQSFLARTPIETVIVVGTTDAPVPAGMRDYEGVLAAAAPMALETEVEETSAAAMCYTSGTTGRSKGVVYSHRAVALHSLTLGLADNFGLREADTVMPVVPMFHANAWGLPYGAAIVGANLVLPGRQLDARSLRELLGSQRVSFTAGVPTVWNSLLQLLDAEPGVVDLSSIRAMLVGGAAVPESLLRGFGERHAIEIIHAWGMTELAPLGTIARVPTRLANASLEARYRYRATQGTPAPFIEIRARSEAGLIPWDGEAMGELEVRGPWVAAGYHGAGIGAAAFTDDGWFRTGDIVAIDPFGGIEIRDRAKDLVKSGGEWISSVELEKRLMDHPDVLEAAVIAVPHPRWQERPFAAVVLKEARATAPEVLLAWVADGVPRWWVPDALVFIDAIPRTSTGKFLKSALRERYQGWYTSA